MGTVTLNFMVLADILLLLFLTVANVEASDKEIEKIAAKAVQNAVDDFINLAEMAKKPENKIRYFPQQTPKSKKVADDAKLLKTTINEFKKLTKQGGSDYALDNAGEKMSTEEITKLALEALSKKNKEMKKKGGSDYQQSEADDYDGMKLNPVTGNCVLKEEKTEESSEETDVSASTCNKALQITTCHINSRYRTIDGTCNNLAKTHWGATTRAFIRIRPAEYPNEKDSFKDRAKHRDTRSGKTGDLNIKLPNARFLSKKLHQVLGRKNPSCSRSTHMLMQFGQYLDHDITLTPEAELRCCRKEWYNKKDRCENIYIQKNERRTDFIYNFPTSYKQLCIPFTRSDYVCEVAADAKREQFNALTIFVDQSATYGSEARIANALRTKVEDLIFNQTTAQWENLGTLAKSKERFNLPRRIGMGLTEVFEADPHAKVSGDGRCNEQPGLLMMHTVFFLEHNRIATELQKTKAIRDYLKKLRTTKEKSDFIYEESRRLLGGIFQSITYREYLPLVLGNDLMEEYGLNVEPGVETEYDRFKDPTCWNEFATFSYRFGHTLISKDFLTKSFLGETGNFALKNTFFNETTMQNQDKRPWWPPVLKGLCTQKAECADRFMNPTLTNELFLAKENIEVKHKNKDQVELSDLAARNIQRGRDHGLSNYNEYRKWAGLRDLTGFGIRPCYECCRCYKGRKKCQSHEENQGLWYCGKRWKSCKRCLSDRAKKVKANIRSDKAIQMNLDDFIELGEAYLWFLDIIDPFTGGFFETIVDGGEVGRTNGKIIADQFERLKYGDRFFFTHRNNNNARGLGPVARENAMKMTLSAVLCENIPRLNETSLNYFRLQEKAFILNGKERTCSHILDNTRMDFKAIAAEIVRSVDKGSTRRNNQKECNFDDDCDTRFVDKDGNTQSYTVCSNQKCTLVTGECVDDSNCSGGKCENNFCLFKDNKQAEFRRECQQQNNCEAEKTKCEEL